MCRPQPSTRKGVSKNMTNIISKYSQSEQMGRFENGKMIRNIDLSRCFSNIDLAFKGR